MQKMGVRPDEYTMVGLVIAIYDSNVLKIGEAIHGYCLKLGIELNSHVSSLLVSMYCRVKCMGSAFRVFDGIVEPDLIAWSALISGVSLCGNSVEALDIFRKMNTKGGKADVSLIATVLTACSQLTVVQPGGEIHGYAFRQGYHLEVMVSSALVDIYCSLLSFWIRSCERRSLFYTKVQSAYFKLVATLTLKNGNHFIMLEEILDHKFSPDKFATSSEASQSWKTMLHVIRLTMRSLQQLFLEPWKAILMHCGKNIPNDGAGRSDDCQQEQFIRIIKMHTFSI
ncbi:hypothetical protein K7X08_034900 [Anisodus acutangulus]|uniref:Pentatricopeptide repeat-containing protein n=1 Tax=Anisodus acutangulus TaxID=402998 RepID=A0A9Q1LGK1_9SOLA|nr:hypothetical protein K7X08_034900 [Anisodus acutangulus]